MATIPKDHLNNVCRLGQPNVCSFLVFGSRGFECAKGTPVKTVIRARRANGSMNAMSDNCSGPPNFKPPTGSN